MIQTPLDHVDRIDQAVTILLPLRAMFGCMMFFLNPDGTRIESPQAEIEDWARDVKDRLDNAMTVLTNSETK